MMQFKKKEFGKRMSRIPPGLPNVNRTVCRPSREIDKRDITLAK